jgi:rare lipoprotein A
MILSTGVQKQCWFICALLIIGLAASCSKPPLRHQPVYDQQGYASYYGGKFHGRKTASGERFDQNALTAAHRSLAFGTWVEVSNLVNGRSVRVRINDRGPFVRGRIIDVSYAAARKLGMLRDGIVRVRVRVTQ